MITNAGKDVIKRFFGGQTRQIGGEIVLGTGTGAVAVGDTALGNEVIRIQVNAVAADLANSRIIFKGIIPAGIAAVGPITELGLVHTGDNADPAAGALVARILLGAPKTLDTAITTEVEYSLKVTV